MPNDYLITGGAGFIGINAAAHYLERGDRVAILDNFSRPGSEHNVCWLRELYGNSFRIIAADVCEDTRELDEAAGAADVILHLAAQVAVTTSVTDPVHDFRVNALGTLNVLEAARKASCPPIVLYSSTNKVYGKMADIPIQRLGDRYEYEGENASGISEARPLDFYSPYGCSKGSGDQYTLDYARIYGLRSVVMRQSCIYGPHQFGMEDQGWVAWFSIRASQNRPVTIYGDGRQVRDVLHVRDLIRAYDLAVEQIDKTAGQAYNVGGGPENTMSLLELIGLLENHFGRPLQFSFRDWRPGDQKVFVSDIRKARRDLGWQPETAIAKGVGELLSWLAANHLSLEQTLAAAV